MTTTLLRHDSLTSELSADSPAVAALGAVQTASGNLPLTHIDVRSRVNGLACETRIIQTFRNSRADFVEATYIFPLPGRFAVTDCAMRVGERRITAELKERSQARADYTAAIQAGKRASIAEEERSEVFSLRVGNIPPQEEISVELTLVGTLVPTSGELTLRVPLVVAPRYASGEPLDGPSVGLGTEADTDAVPDASRVSPPILLKGMPNPVQLSLAVEISPGPHLSADELVRGLRCSLHNVSVDPGHPCRIKLLPGERLDRDFILRFPALPALLQSTLEYEQSAEKKARTFAVTLYPPRLAEASSHARDVVFVLDRSGSMEGWKMVAARRALARMIDTLRETDRFRVLAFDTSIECPPTAGNDWQNASDRHRLQAAEWVAKVDSRGGTELGAALRAALQSFTGAASNGREPIVVLITDGQVSGEDSVLKTIRALGLPRLPRIFSLGIDRAVNASMLTRLADTTHGAFEIVESENRLDVVLAQFHRDWGTAILTDIQFEPLDFDLAQSFSAPQRTPDLFADRPVTIYGRIPGGRDSIRLKVTGRTPTGEVYSEVLTTKRSATNSLLPLWGRSRVRDLEHPYAAGSGDLQKLSADIVATSLEAHVLSRFTAYVAVDHSEIVNQTGVVEQVVQPVELPEGWADQKFDSAFSSTAVPTRMARSRGLMKTQNILKCAIEVPDVMAAAPAPASPAATPPDVTELVPESVARENMVIPIAEQGDALVMKMADPNDLETIDKLRFILNRPIIAVPGSAEEVADAIDRSYEGGDGGSADSVLMEFSDTAIDFTESETAQSIADVKIDESSAPIVRMVNLMITEAVQMGGACILIHVLSDRMEIIYVIDGQAKQHDLPPVRLANAIRSRLLILAKLDIGARTTLQAGELKVTIGTHDVDLRLYFIPTPVGWTMALVDTARPRLKCQNNETQNLVAEALECASQAAGHDAALGVIVDQLRSALPA